MTTLPYMEKNVNHSPHVVILGAGASLAAFPNGDANGKKLPLMDTIIETLGLTSLLDNNGISYKKRGFEDLYSDLSLNPAYDNVRKIIEEEIYNYFYEMEIPDEPTLYDYLILSLREKDLIATFNWDPLLFHALKRNAHIKNLPQIAFLHGNVAVGCCHDCKILGNMYNEICHNCYEPFLKMQLLYPVKQKDYSNDLIIKDQWTLLRNKLSYAYFLTIFGYSAPASDVDAKNLMLEVWKKNKTLSLSEVQIIDIKDKTILEETWDEFFFSHHYSIQNNIENSCLWSFPRRSCEAFAAATLYLKPWPDNKFLNFKTIDEMHEWLQPLLVDEINFENDKTPFSYMTES